MLSTYHIHSVGVNRLYMHVDSFLVYIVGKMAQDVGMM